MKAIINESYGSPEVMQLKEVEKPLPADDEVLIQVKAASVNPLDGHILSGMLPVRFALGLFKPKYKILGADIAGIVESTGGKINKLKLGNEVYGNVFKSGLGGFAEFVAVKESEVVEKPASISFEEAAAMPVAAVTALQALNSNSALEQVSSVLINGASGGVGTFAVQLAKAHGAIVTAVCSTTNLSLVESLGADHVIDYTREDVCKGDQRYDLIIDNVGNLSNTQYKKLLTANGHCAVVGFNGLGQLIRTSLFGGDKIKMVDVKTTKEDLLYLNDLVEKGELKSIIDRSYSLEETANAVTYVKKRHAKGKVIISMNQSNQAKP